MSKYRNYEEIKARLEENVKYYDARIKAWQQVERATKKDGSDFKVFSKNFNGAETGKYYPIEDYSNPYLTVAFEDENGRYTTDQMSLKADKHLTEQANIPEHNDEREVRYSYGYPVEILTVEETWTAIQNLIQKYKHWKAEAERELAESKAHFEKIDALLDEVNNTLKEISPGDLSSTARYAFREYITNNIRW